MPELPDVKIFKRYFDSTSLKQKINNVSVNNAKVLKGVSAAKLNEILSGRSFRKTYRHGKNLFAELKNDLHLHLHFGMTGSLEYYKDRSETKHQRVVFDFTKDRHLAFVCPRMFGKLEIVESVEDYISANKLGPDAERVEYSQFRDLILNSRSAIKSALMNQSLIAGIGNIYSDEILFQAKINPKADCSSLGENAVKRLYRNMSKVFDKAVEKKADPRKLPNSYLLRHRGKGEECPKCGGEVKFIKFSGRGAYYCPACQK